MKCAKIAIFVILLTGIALADEGHGMEFPVWTYYAEIVEHLIIFAFSSIAIIFHYKFYKKYGRNIIYAIAGWAIIAIGEALTTAHHFLFYPFGEINAIVNHGLLLAGLFILAFAYIKILGEEKSKKQ